MIDSSLEVLRQLYRLGARYLGLTHSGNTPWVGAAEYQDGPKGLTDFGKEVVREMNRLGMMIDMSHASEQAFYDAIETSRAPILNTHAACRAIANHPRNLTDAMLKALAKNGGILGVAYYSGMLDDGHRARFPELAQIGRRRGEVIKQFRDDKKRLSEELWQLNLAEAGQLKGYDDFFPIGLFATAPYSLHARFPINSVADLKGKKIRTAGAIEGAAIKALGAVPIGLPVTEIAEAVGRGTIDGTSSHPSPLFDFGIDRVTNHHFFTRLGIVPLAILMSRKKFDSVPRQCQDAIRKYSGAWTAARFNDGIGSYNDSLVKKLQADSKRKVVFPSPAEIETMSQMMKPVVDEWLARSPRNQELFKLVEGELVKVRAGR